MPSTTSQKLKNDALSPNTGVFTDGCSIPNPGPGGWAFIHVEENKILHSEHGYDSDTTNNRMELTALLKAYQYLPEDASLPIFSDSNLCVQTFNGWVHSWKKNGWKRKEGEIANLDLIKAIYEERVRHPKVTLHWIKAHVGFRWNEAVDQLASCWKR
jgi:ribonuclease HI